MRNLIVLLVFIFTSCDDFPGDFNKGIKQEFSENNVLCLQFSCNRIPCDSVFADGIARIDLDAYVPAEIEESKNLIQLSTENGTFLSSGNSESKQLVASRNIGPSQCMSTRRMIAANDVLISSTTAGKFRVTMTVEKVSRMHIFKFITAEIESIKLAADKFAIFNTESSEAVLTATGERLLGTPSSGQFIDFKVILADDDNTEIMEDWKFRNTINETNNQSQATTTFTVGNINNYTGEIYCIACLNKVEIGAICDTLRMEVIEG